MVEIDGHDQTSSIVRIKKPISDDHKLFLDELLEEHGAYLDVEGSWLELKKGRIVWAVEKELPEFDQPTAAYSYFRHPDGLIGRMKMARAAFDGRTIESHLAYNLEQGRGAVTVETQDPFTIGTATTNVEVTEVLDFATRFFDHASELVGAYGVSSARATLHYGQLRLTSMNHIPTRKAAIFVMGKPYQEPTTIRTDPSHGSHD